MFDPDYHCIKCGWKMPDKYQSMLCKCGGDMRPKNRLHISGTRDSFGVGKEFIDDTTGDTIDTWKKWERAGYRNPLEVTKNTKVKEVIKRKMQGKDVNDMT